jgi:hypothetical protein
MHRLLPLRRILIPILLAGCAPAVAAPPAPAASAEQAWVADRLFFGRSIPGGGTVSEEAWSAFLAEVVTLRFPDGLTVWRAEGQWRNAQGSIDRESTFVVEVFHPADGAADAALREIAAEYKRRFRQESVLMVRLSAEVDFFD